jgi:hypothetical protein
LGNLKEVDSLEVLGVGEIIMLEWVLKKNTGRMWSGLIWLKLRPGSRLI